MQRIFPDDAAASAQLWIPEGKVCQTTSDVPPQNTPMVINQRMHKNIQPDVIWHGDTMIVEILTLPEVSSCIKHLLCQLAVTLLQTTDQRDRSPVATLATHVGATVQVWVGLHTRYTWNDVMARCGSPQRNATGLQQPSPQRQSAFPRGPSA